MRWLGVRGDGWLADNAPWTVKSNVNDVTEWPCVSGVIENSSNVGAVRTHAMDRTEIRERNKAVGLVRHRHKALMVVVGRF